MEKNTSGLIHITINITINTTFLIQHLVHFSKKERGQDAVKLKDLLMIISILYRLVD
jgi:hypothetical protein